MKHTFGSHLLGIVGFVIACVVSGVLTTASQSLGRSQPVHPPAEPVPPFVPSRPPQSQAHVGSDRAIVDDAAAALRRSQPSWRFIGGFCDCGALLAEQQSVSVGSWLHKVGGNDVQVADAHVYLVSTSDVATRWIVGYDQRPIAEGWTATPYTMGMASFLATYRDGKRYEVVFAQDRFIATVSGASKSYVDVVAKALLEQVLGR